jgi:parvulin-like peptidyl-prolyl isomerase
MKTCLLSLVLGAALCAQSSPAKIDPSTVVAKIGDHDITAAEITQIIQTWPPELAQKFQQNPADALRQVYTVKYLAAEADKRKLGDEDPWKGQVETAREQILATAMATYENNHFPVSEQDINAYYARNKSRYLEAKIKVIKLDLREPIPAGTSQDDVKKAAETMMRNSHLKTLRSDTEAAALAADIVKQLRAGADFADLARKYSDDDSKSTGGDFGVVTPAGSYPEQLKKAVFALKPGELADSIRLPYALYIVRLEDLTAQPLAQVNEQIVAQIRNEHLTAFAEDLGKRLTPKLIHPEFFLPTGPSPLPAKP